MKYFKINLTDFHMGGEFGGFVVLATDRVESSAGFYGELLDEFLPEAYARYEGEWSIVPGSSFIRSYSWGLSDEVDMAVEDIVPISEEDYQVLSKYVPSKVLRKEPDKEELLAFVRWVCDLGMSEDHPADLFGEIIERAQELL